MGWRTGWIGWESAIESELRRASRRMSRFAGGAVVVVVDIVDGIGDVVTTAIDVCSIGVVKIVVVLFFAWCLIVFLGIVAFVVVVKVSFGFTAVTFSSVILRISCSDTTDEIFLNGGMVTSSRTSTFGVNIRSSSSLNKYPKKSANRSEVSDDVDEIGDGVPLGNLEMSSTDGLDTGFFET